MTTMEDIARRLSVSKGTVSKALSGATDISEILRKSILETAVEMGYARIQRSDGRRLCVLVTNMAYQYPGDFGYDLIMGFRKLAEPGGFRVDVVELTDDLQQQYSYDAFMLKNDYVGAFVLGLHLQDSWTAVFEICRTPAVLFDYPPTNHALVASVETDNYEGMCLAVARLKELGHQTIGYLGGLPLSYIFQQRQSAFFSAMRTCGLPVDKSFSGTAHRTSVCLETHFQRLRDKGCTAIICSHDLLANALLVHCRENGLSVPRDLSVIGMDDIPLSQHTDPPLTTIRQNRLELGRCAYYAMSSLLSGVPVSRLLLQTELVERGSIGPAGGQRTGTSD